MHKHGGGGGQLAAEGFTQASAPPFPASASRVNFLPNTKREVPEGKGGRHEEEEEGRGTVYYRLMINHLAIHQLAS